MQSRWKYQKTQNIPNNLNKNIYLVWRIQVMKNQKMKEKIYGKPSVEILLLEKSFFHYTNAINLPKLTTQNPNKKLNNKSFKKKFQKKKKNVHNKLKQNTLRCPIRLNLKNTIRLILSLKRKRKGKLRKRQKTIIESQFFLPIKVLIELTLLKNFK